MQSKAFVILEDRGVISVVGDETSSFLQGLISNDIEKVDSTTAIYATLLTAQGKFLHDFFIAQGPDGGILIDCEGDRRADLLRRLTMYRLRAKVELADVSDDFVVVGLIGDDVLDALELGDTPGSARHLHGGVVFTDPRLPAMGARAIVPSATVGKAFADDRFGQGSTEEYRDLRLAYGLPDGSRDIVVEKYFPLECGFEELHAIDYEKGCYVGQELTARTHHRGTIKKRLMPVAVDGPLPPPGTAVLRDEREVGEIRSGAANRAIALIRLEHFNAVQNENISLSAGDAKVTPIKPAWARF